MASRRAPGPFALSPLQGGRRAVRRRRTPGAAAIALAVVILGAIVFAALAALH
jgi:hypothetical protein